MDPLYDTETMSAPCACSCGCTMTIVGVQERGEICRLCKHGKHAPEKLRD